ncbi:cytochrome P450 family protein [Embleya scabrispora]|nr:P450-derived glycosyltransferase activator [Embleya scabrispora]
MAIRTDSELGRSLLTERGMQWLYAHGGDPYAVLIRAEDDDRATTTARIRELGPLHRSHSGAWVSGNHALGREILGDPRLVSRVLHGPWAGGPEPGEVFSALPAVGFVPAWESADPDRWASFAERRCAAVLGRLGDSFDLVADLVRPVLVGVVGEVLAVPSAERAAFGRWCGSAATALDAVLCPPTLPRARALIDAVEGLRSLSARSTGPDEELLAFAMTASVVGLETTANLLANTMLALLNRPDRWRLVCADPTWAHSAVEETLRLDPPVRLDSRIVNEDLELAGRAITAGSEVVVCLEAAHTDPELHRDPQDFDLRRETAADHLSLSGGPPFAVVAPLVRASTVAVLRVLAARLPAVRRAGPVVRRLRAPVTQGIVRFPVAC